MLRQQDFAKAHIVLAAWREGIDYGGHLPGTMVMHCIMNRVKLGWGSHLEVVQRLPQFSSTIIQPHANMYPSIWEPAFVRLLHEVDSAYEGSAKDLTNGALYWADLRNITNPWFKDAILGKLDTHRRIADFGSLSFFQ